MEAGLRYNADTKPIENRRVHNDDPQVGMHIVQVWGCV
jgi:hypothetical protein